MFAKHNFNYLISKTKMLSVLILNQQQRKYENTSGDQKYDSGGPTPWQT